MGEIKLSKYVTDPTMDSETPFLVVDDSDTARNAVVSSLREIGFDGPIYDVANLADAVKTLKTKKVRFILCDWQLENGREGIELLDAVRKVSTKAPFIMITSLDEVENILKAIEKGASEYLVKPCNPTDLKEKILNALKNHNKANS